MEKSTVDFGRGLRQFFSKPCSAAIVLRPSIHGVNLCVLFDGHSFFQFCSFSCVMQVNPYWILLFSLCSWCILKSSILGAHFCVLTDGTSFYRILFVFHHNTLVMEDHEFWFMKGQVVRVDRRTFCWSKNILLSTSVHIFIRSYSVLRWPQWYNVIPF